MLLFKIIGFWFFILFGVLINGYLTDSTTTASTDKCSIIISITKDKGKIESSNYPKPYPTDCLWTYIIHIGVGYKLKLVINDLDVDIESGDAFIIEPTTGSRVEIENHSHSKQSPITKESTSEENAHSAIITFLAKDHVNTRRGFSFNYERIEEPNTEKPSDAELPGWIQLYLAGVSAFEFNLMQDHFKEATAKLTKQYIDMKHISNENLSAIENDIIINSMEPCPSSWPWASTCIQLNFSIKLTDNNFELNSEHLKEIWDSHRSSEDFYHLGITEYELPDVEWFIWFWIFLIGFISLVFAFLLVIVVRTKLIHYYFLKLQETKPESSATRASRNWSTQPLSYPFNAENDQRFQFVREYERHVSRPTYSGRNGVENASCGNHSDDAVDDFDSEDEQHIYHSLDYK